MSEKHPIIGVTGSSGAGTSTATRVMEGIFHQLGIRAVIIEGDAFHAYDREQVRQALERTRIRGENFSLFGPSANLLERLEATLREYGEQGSGTLRHYLHTEAEAIEAGQPAGTFTPWEPIPPRTDMLFYEGLHGGFVSDEINIAGHMDLLIGVTPVINLEWIQKIRRDTDERGYRPEEVTGTILRRMPDYVNYIAPQFSRTDVNFQRVPLVDTSNPFTVRDIPAPEETLFVVHFNEHSRIRADINALMQALPGSFCSRAQTLVVPGPLQAQAMELILRPAVQDLNERRQDATRRDAA